MSELIAGHAHAVRVFFQILKENKATKISECKDQISISRIFRILDITGKEERSFTDDEIRKVLTHYKYFENYLRRQGLWIELNRYN